MSAQLHHEFADEEEPQKDEALDWFRLFEFRYRKTTQNLVYRNESMDVLMKEWAPWTSALPAKFD